MYFWDSRRLAVDLRNDALSPAQLKNYLIALFIIGLPFGIASIGITRQERLLWSIDFTITVVATVIGMNLAYKANRGTGRFVEKVVALMLPLTIQATVLSFIVLIGLVFAASPLELDASGTPQFDGLTSRVMDFVAYSLWPWLMYRLVRHIPDTVPNNTEDVSAGIPTTTLPDA